MKPMPASVLALGWMTLMTAGSRRVAVRSYRRTAGSHRVTVGSYRTTAGSRRMTNEPRRMSANSPREACSWRPTTAAARRSLSALAGVLLVCAAVLAGAAPAVAHPLGNFTVNHYTGVTLHPGRVDALVVVDRAEIAAAQERPRVDRDHDGSVDATEAHRYAAAQCALLADQLRVAVRGRPLADWRRPRSALSYHPGQAGLRTSRLSCALTAPADLRSPAGVTLRTAYDTARIGWHEVTARGEGVTLTASDVPNRSATDELRRYPQDPLASPLDQRSATLRAEPGGSGAAAAVRSALPDSGPVGTALGKVTGTFDSLVGRHELTFPLGLLALLLAVVLGASHAAMPGHGKTLMAAYLAGRRGTPRDAVTVGVTVTLTHTAGVLVLGLALPLSTGLAGEAVLTWLGLASGLLVTAIGAWLLHSALRGREAGHHHHHHHGPGGHHHGPGGHHHGPTGHHHGPGGHHHGPGGPHHHGPEGHAHHHGPEGHAHHHEPHAHGSGDHDHAHTPHPHDKVLTIPATAPPHPALSETAAPGETAVLTEDPPAPPRTPAAKGARTSSRRGLIGLGVAGGLVPSPSALVVLLGAVALGRTAFGVLLVLAYGLGMAGTLTLAGLLLVRLRDRLDARARLAAARLAPLRRLARLGPVLTSCLVLVVGAGLTLRACAGPW
ncbi:high-affinity nickel-transporter [Streptomyces albus]|uniref:High-affinity nickel-transporter n=2 Tax=Streptomyces TaxID=1883 RepID=A0A0B5F004_STRA4|nr:high-affinity nickel-transporter [Streptomyces albus]AOU77970.1 high-affinity nickel-transporter [Streptomyces albus]AYN33724.1 high-affinity nickel-transporter [Streptomyces albus]